MCSYQSVYLGVSFFNILEKRYLKISQMSVDRYVIFVLLLFEDFFQFAHWISNIFIAG